MEMLGIGLSKTKDWFTSSGPKDLMKSIPSGIGKAYTQFTEWDPTIPMAGAAKAIGQKYQDFTEWDPVAAAKKALFKPRNIPQFPQFVGGGGIPKPDEKYRGNGPAVSGTDERGAIYGSGGYGGGESLRTAQLGTFLVMDKVAWSKEEAYDRKQGKYPKQGMSLYQPGKNYITTKTEPPPEEFAAVKKHLAYEDRIAAGDNKSRFQFTSKTPATYNRMDASEIKNTEIANAMAESKKAPLLTPSVVTTKSGKQYKQISTVKVDTDGAYDLTLIKEAQDMDKKGYLKAYYSTLKDGDKRYSEAAKQMKEFAAVTKQLQALRNSPTRPWINDSENYFKVVDKYTQLRHKFMPEFYKGMDFRRKALMYKYGDPKLVGKFGPEIEGTSSNPKAYVAALKRAVEKEAKYGMPELSKKNIRYLQGVRSPAGVVDIENILSNMGLSKNMNAYDLLKRLLESKDEDAKKMMGQLKHKTVLTKHTGGLIPTDGIYSMKTGEIVVPNEVADVNSFKNLLNQSPAHKESLNESKELDPKKFASAIEDAVKSGAEDIKSSMEEANIDVSVKDEDKVLKVDSSDAAQAIAESVTTAISSTPVKLEKKDVQVKVDFDADGAGRILKEHLESVKLDAKLDTKEVSLAQDKITAVMDKPVKVEVSDLQKASVGADKYDKLKEDQASIVESLATLANFVEGQAADIEIIGNDMKEVKANSISYNEAQRIAEDQVNVMANKLTIDIRDVATTADYSRSQLQQVANRVDYIDDKYDREVGGLKSQTHANVSNLA